MFGVEFEQAHFVEFIFRIAQPLLHRRVGVEQVSVHVANQQEVIDGFEQVLQVVLLLIQSRLNILAVRDILHEAIPYQSAVFTARHRAYAEPLKVSGNVQHPNLQISGSQLSICCARGGLQGRDIGFVEMVEGQLCILRQPLSVNTQNALTSLAEILKGKAAIRRAYQLKKDNIRQMIAHPLNMLLAFFKGGSCFREGFSGLSQAHQKSKQ